MPACSWANPPQLEFLKGLAVDFVVAQEKKETKKFWDSVESQFFTLWPTQEAEIAAAAAWVSPDGSKPKISKKKKKSTLPDAPPTEMSQTQWNIHNWYNNHGSQKSKGPKITIAVAKSSVRVASEHHLYSKKYFEERVKPILDAQFGNTKPSIKDINLAIKTAYKNESEEVKAEIKQAQDQERVVKEMAKDEDASLTQTEPSYGSSPQEYLKAQTTLPKLMQEFCNMMQARTGWAVSILAGGPDPSAEGRIRTLSVHTGSNEHGFSFGKAFPTYFNDVIMPYSAFLKTVFPEHVRAKFVVSEEQKLRQIRDAAGNAVAQAGDDAGLISPGADDAASKSDGGLVPKENPPQTNANPPNSSCAPTKSPTRTIDSLASRAAAATAMLALISPTKSPANIQPPSQNMRHQGRRQTTNENEPGVPRTSAITPMQHPGPLRDSQVLNNIGGQHVGQSHNSDLDSLLGNAHEFFDPSQDNSGRQANSGRVCHPSSKDDSGNAWPKMGSLMSELMDPNLPSQQNEEYQEYGHRYIPDNIPADYQAQHSHLSTTYPQQQHISTQYHRLSPPLATQQQPYPAFATQQQQPYPTFETQQQPYATQQQSYPQQQLYATQQQPYATQQQPYATQQQSYPQQQQYPQQQSYPQQQTYPQQQSYPSYTSQQQSQPPLPTTQQQQQQLPPLATQAEPLSPPATQPAASAPIVTQAEPVPPPATQPAASPPIVTQAEPLPPPATQPAASAPIVTASPPIVTQAEPLPPPATQPAASAPIVTQAEPVPPPATQLAASPPIVTQAEPLPPPATQPAASPPIVTQAEPLPPPATQPAVSPPIVTQPVASPPIVTQQQQLPLLATQTCSSPPLETQDVALPPIATQQATSPPLVAQPQSSPPLTRSRRIVTARNEAVPATAKEPLVSGYEWFNDGMAYLRSGLSDDKWGECLAAWEKFEKDIGLKETTSHRLGAKLRPSILSKWFTNGRHYDDIPIIENSDCMADDWLDWWNAIQPKWRQANGKGSLPLPLSAATAKDDIGCLRKAGPTGLISALIGLKWWSGARERDERWFEAVADMTQCFESFMNTPTKRKAEAEGSGNEKKKRKTKV